MKRFISLLLALSVCFSMTRAVSAAQPAHFTDVPETFWAYSYIERAYAAGVVSGTSGDPANYTGVFSPSSSLTNAQFSAILARGFFKAQVDEETSKGNTSPWYAPYMAANRANGVLYGTAIESNPTSIATRYDMAMAMTALLKSAGASMPDAAALQAAQSKIGDWASVPANYQESVRTVYALGLISGVNQQGDFSGNGGVSRAAMCAVYCRLMDALSPSANTSAPTAPASETYPGTGCLTYTSFIGTPLKRYDGSTGSYIYDYTLNQHGTAHYLDYSDYLVKNGFQIYSLLSDATRTGVLMGKGKIGIGVVFDTANEEVVITPIVAN